jgi:hypothetical protein
MLSFVELLLGINKFFKLNIGRKKLYIEYII